MSGLRLSICIATLNRAKFIEETLESIIPQLTPEVELVIVDGASSDGTAEILERYTGQCSRLRYFREQTNSGIDADYDKAVGYASGDFCWLMTDDDLLVSGSVQRVLSALRDDLDLIVANARVMDDSLTTVLTPRLLDFSSDQNYSSGDPAPLFIAVADYLSFIGGTIVRREFWQRRERAAYYGSLFVHVGVLFQQPAVSRASVIAEPLISIRYGNAMWTPRTFEIWMFKWPALVWSFTDFSVEDKARVCLKEPWRNVRRLLFYRALSRYSVPMYEDHLQKRLFGPQRLLAFLIARVPGKFANACVCAYCFLIKMKIRSQVFELARCEYSNPFTRAIARHMGISA